MNTLKFVLCFATLLAASPVFADMNGSSPSPTGGSNLPAPLATPTAPTAVTPNGATQTAPSPTSTSAAPTASNSAQAQQNNAVPATPGTPSYAPPIGPSTPVTQQQIDQEKQQQLVK
ncbi:MAG: hypothetical protein V4501_08935 [Pseudomonadota bacterium]